LKKVTIASDICAERKKEGKSDNWVLYLGRVMASINGHKSRLKDSVSSYRTVYGCDYHLLTSSSMQDARDAKTVKDIAPLIIDDGHFSKYLNDNYDLNSSPSTTPAQDKQDDLKYWNYTEDEMKLVKEEYKQLYENIRINS
jgi:hypothetical protein